MKILLSLLSFLSVFAVSLSAQNNIDVMITDQYSEPIFFATVALYNGVDSTLVSAESTNDKGVAVFENVNAGQYYLISNMLSYENAIKDNLVMEGENILVEMMMAPDANLIETIEIKASVPLLEQKADKLIVNVSDNITNTSGSLLDVMKKVPGMLVINDRLSMAGSGTPTILINGKSTQYMDVQSLLRDMPGENIKKVEIIHQPGAEYEASGSGPILNIILKKNSLFGTNGSVSVGVGKGELWDYTTGLNLSHYSGPINITAGLGVAQNAYVDGLLIDRRLSNISPAIDGTYEQRNRDAATPLTSRANIRVDVDMTSRHRIGVDAKVYNNNNQRIATNDTEVDLMLGQDYKLNTENDKDKKWSYTAVNPYYIFEIDTMGQKLEYDVNYAQYKPDDVNTLSTTNSLNSNVDKQRYTQLGDTKILATSADYTKPLNKIFELKAGLRYSFADLDNDLNSEFTDVNGDWQNNTQQSNRFLFDERIYSAYTKLLYNYGDWTGTAGLRYENSQSRGRSETIDSTLTRDISKLFPSLSLTRKLGSSFASTLSYSYRIDRPRYSTLNPFVYYLDPFTFETGNPNIRPELTHSAKFTLSMEGQPFFNIEYKESTDAIVEVTRQEPDSEEASKTDVNFDFQSNLSASLFFPLDFIPGVAGGYGGVIVTKNNFTSFFGDANFERTKWSTTAVIQLEFELPLDISAEIGGWYNSGEQEGIFNSEHIYGSSAGFSKKFLNNKAKLSIGIEDFVNRFWHANVDYQQDIDIVSTWQAPTVSARFSYKFGNQHLKSRKKKSGSASEEVRRATQK